MKQERRVLKTLGKNIRKERLARSMSQMYLAAEAGLDKSYIGAIETNGKDPGQKPYRFLKAIRKSNFMSVSPPRSACLLAKVA